MSTSFATARAGFVAGLLAAAGSLAAQTFTIEMTRFGPCLSGGCVVEIADNDALDLNPAAHVIDFAVPRVGDPPTAFSATGRAIETLGLDPFGQVRSILMTLTDTTVQGTLGAPIGGQIGLISSQPLRSPFGVSGFASLDGEYRSFAGGVIDDTDILLQARLGGLLLGLVNPPGVDGLPSPQAFAGFDARAWNLPVANKLFGIFDFTTAAGSGFVLPASGEAFAVAIPEPAAVLLMGLGLLPLAALARHRQRRDGAPRH